MGKSERVQDFGLNHQSNAHNKTHHTLQKGSYAGHGQKNIKKGGIICQRKR